jgi:hypothetical protein
VVKYVLHCSHAIARRKLLVTRKDTDMRSDIRSSTRILQVYVRILQTCVRTSDRQPGVGYHDWGHPNQGAKTVLKTQTHVRQPGPQRPIASFQSGRKEQTQRSPIRGPRTQCGPSKPPRTRRAISSAGRTNGLSAHQPAIRSH